VEQLARSFIPDHKGPGIASGRGLGAHVFHGRATRQAARGGEPGMWQSLPGAGGGRTRPELAGRYVRGTTGAKPFWTKDNRPAVRFDSFPSPVLPFRGAGNMSGTQSTGILGPEMGFSKRVRLGRFVHSLTRPGQNSQVPAARPISGRGGRWRFRGDGDQDEAAHDVDRADFETAACGSWSTGRTGGMRWGTDRTDWKAALGGLPQNSAADGGARLSIDCPGSFQHLRAKR